MACILGSELWVIADRKSWEFFLMSILALTARNNRKGPTWMWRPRQKKMQIWTWVRTGFFFQVALAKGFTSVLGRRAFILATIYILLYIFLLKITISKLYILRSFPHRGLYFLKHGLILLIRFWVIKFFFSCWKVPKSSRNDQHWWSSTPSM